MTAALTATGRPRQRFCYRGHDTDVVGRAMNGNCKGCKRERNAARMKARYVREYVPSVQAILVPTEPLRVFLATRHRSVNDTFDVGTNYNRYAYRPLLSMRVADEIACSLGVHPYEIWGWDWFTYGTYTVRQILASEGVGL